MSDQIARGHLRKSVRFLAVKQLPASVGEDADFTTPLLADDRTARPPRLPTAYVPAHAACGRPPFGDEAGHGVLYRIVHEAPDPQPLRELEPDLAEGVAACLDRDPQARPSAAELVGLAAGHRPFGSAE
ncbi:hypothetical protein [Streptomyces sp. YKOK-I1]